jgi:hypothetical protein
VDSSYLEGYEQKKRLNAVKAPIHKVAHEQVINLRTRTTYSEELKQVVKLAVNVTAERDWRVYSLHICLFNKDFLGLVAELQDLMLLNGLSTLQLFNPSTIAAINSEFPLKMPFSRSYLSNSLMLRRGLGCLLHGQGRTPDIAVMGMERLKDSAVLLPLAARIRTRSFSVHSKWDATLNLPKTAFPIRSALNDAEYCDTIARQLYEAQLQRASSGAVPFSITDGPPFANGDLHVGKTLANLRWPGLEMQCRSCSE